MVWHDPFSNYETKTQSDETPSDRPGVLDRVAAFNLDLLLIFPIAKLLQAPIERYSNQLWVIDQIGYWPRYMLLGAIPVFVFMLYQVVFLSLYQATPGMMAFNMKIVSRMRLTRPSLSRIALRVLLLMIQTLLMLGLPLWSILLWKRRLGLHDLISDTQLISTEFKASGWVDFSRKKVFACFCLHFIFAMFFALRGSIDLSSVEVTSCEEYSKDSLDMHLSYFFLGKVDGTCLKRRSEKQLWQDQASAEGYLAMALATSDDPEKSDRYLAQVCKEEKESSACAFSSWITHKSFGDDQSFAHLDFTSSNLPDYLLIHSIGFFQKTGAWSKMLELIPKLEQEKKYSKFKELMTFKAMLGEKRWGQGYWLYVNSEFLTKKHLSALITEAFENKWEQKNKLAGWIRLHFIDKGRGIASDSDEEFSEMLDIYQALTGSKK